MSDEQKNVSDEIDKELAATFAANNLPSVTTTVPVAKKLDPYILFREIEQMREDGIPEDTIKEAFNQFMEERGGNFRKPQKTLRKSEEMNAMPSQEEINKMYEDRYKNIPIEERDPAIQAIISAIQNADKTKWQNNKKATLKSYIRMYTYKALYFSLNKFLSMVVWTFKKMGIK